jgi:WD40 repeat protein
MNVENPEKSYADETMQLLTDIYNSSYVKMKYLDYSNVSTVNYSPDGKYLAVGTVEGYLYVLDSDTRSLVQVFKLTGKVNDIRISGDSKVIAAISNLNHISVMDIKTGKAIVENIIHPGANRLLFDSDTKRLASYIYIHLEIFYQIQNHLNIH